MSLMIMGGFKYSQGAKSTDLNEEGIRLQQQSKEPAVSLHLTKQQLCTLIKLKQCHDHESIA